MSSAGKVADDAVTELVVVPGDTFESSGELAHAIRTAFPLLPESEIRAAFERLRKTDALYQNMLNAQVAQDAEAVSSQDDTSASNPNVTSLPVCPECAEGHHIYCLDDSSSTWTGKCRCTCGDESRGLNSE